VGRFLSTRHASDPYAFVPYVSRHACDGTLQDAPRQVAVDGMVIRDMATTEGGAMILLDGIDRGGVAERRASVVFVDPNFEVADPVPLMPEWFTSRGGGLAVGSDGVAALVLAASDTVGETLIVEVEPDGSPGDEIASWPGEDIPHTGRLAATADRFHAVWMEGNDPQRLLIAEHDQPATYLGVGAGFVAARGSAVVHTYELIDDPETLYLRNGEGREGSIPVAAESTVFAVGLDASGGGVVFLRRYATDGAMQAAVFGADLAPRGEVVDLDLPPGQYGDVEYIADGLWAVGTLHPDGQTGRVAFERVP
jgi:hypothetical protein